MEHNDRFDQLEPFWKDIQGWAVAETFHVWRYLLRKQREFSLSGHSMEIGSFMGKCSSILAADIDLYRKERLILIDPNIRTQELRSAHGLAGLDSDEAISFYEISSQRISKEELSLKRGDVRWIHIDGEHTGSAVSNDLDIAHELTMDGGIVVLDDFFSVAYPQITFSAVRYLDRYPDRFVPLLIAYGKLYLSRPKPAFWLKQHIAIQLAPELEKAGYTCTLCKTTHSEDLDCLSIKPGGFYQGIMGPDWSDSTIELARSFNMQQLHELADKANKVL